MAPTPWKRYPTAPWPRLQKGAAKVTYALPFCRVPSVFESAPPTEARPLRRRVGCLFAVCYSLFSCIWRSVARLGPGLGPVHVAHGVCNQKVPRATWTGPQFRGHFFPRATFPHLSPGFWGSPPLLMAQTHLRTQFVPPGPLLPCFGLFWVT